MHGEPPNIIVMIENDNPFDQRHQKFDKRFKIGVLSWI